MEKALNLKKKVSCINKLPHTSSDITIIARVMRRPSYANVDLL